MSDSSGYGSNGANGSGNSNSSFNGANAAAENHSDMGSNSSSSLNGGSLAGTSSSSMTNLPSRGTCTSAGGSSARSDNVAHTNQAAAMQVDAEPDSGMGSSLTRTPMNSSTSSLSGDTVAAPSSRASVAENDSMASAPMSAANLTLYNSVLADIRSGLLSLQLPPNTESGNLEADLRVRANLLLQRNLANRGMAPSGQTLGELRRTVDTYCRLIGWLQPEETLENATIEIDYRMQNGSVEKVRCRAADNVKNLQEAISARAGVSSVGTRQLLCNGEPMTDQTQCLYRFVARRGQGMRRAGALTVQEVVRVSSG